MTAKKISHAIVEKKAAKFLNEAKSVQLAACTRCTGSGHVKAKGGHTNPCPDCKGGGFRLCKGCGDALVTGKIRGGFCVSCSNAKFRGVKPGEQARHNAKGDSVQLTFRVPRGFAALLDEAATRAKVDRASFVRQSLETVLANA